MISELVQGTLTADPVRRPSAKGGDFTTATKGVAAGSESIFINVATFGATAAERLLAMPKGATIAAAGTLELNVWTEREASDRQDWRPSVADILTVHQARRRWEREKAEQ